MKRNYPCITTTQGLSGWFAVMLVWNPELGGFAEPECTGMGRYALQADAIKEGQQWAEAEGLPFYGPEVPDPNPARQDVEQQIREIIPDIKVIHL